MEYSHRRTVSVCSQIGPILESIGIVCDRAILDASTRRSRAPPGTQATRVTALEPRGVFESRPGAVLTERVGKDGLEGEFGGSDHQ
jgi:hypothetical protein